MPITLDFHFPEGTPFAIQRKSPTLYSLKPHSFVSGSQTFYLCARINGLNRGEQLELEVHWPRRWTQEDLSKEASKEQIVRQTVAASFIEAIPGSCYLSTDFRNWERIHAIQAGPDEAVLVRIIGTGEPLFFSTQIPYSYDQYLQLLNFIREQIPGAVKQIGHSSAGLPLHAVEINGVGRDRPTIFIQGYQHGTEFAGPWVIDYMIRHLASIPDGQALREKCDFHFVPVVDVDFLFYGISFYQTPKGDQPWRTGNINRDWEKQSWPEVQAVDSFLRQQIKDGRRYVQGFDLHNGWNSTVNAGACYTCFPKDWPDADYVRRQRELASWMVQNTSHCELSLWPHRADGLFSLYFHGLTGGLVSTIEFSRQRWLNRHTNAWELSEQRHLLDFAADALRAVSEYHTAPGRPG